jgi:hypothetical protein
MRELGWLALRRSEKPTVWILRFAALFFYTSRVFSAADWHSPNLTADEIAARLSPENGFEIASLRDYRAIRKYVLDNSRSHQHAEMIVRVSFHDPDNKHSQIMSVNGPEWMIGVLRKILEAEQAPVGTQMRECTRIIPQHYNFRLAGFATQGEQRCYLLEVEPKIKDRFMLVGLVWVDARDFVITRFEGHTEGKVSFWIGRPSITQTFRKLQSVWVPAVTHASAHSGLFGTTELTVTSSEYVLLGTNRDALRAESTTVH